MRVFCKYPGDIAPYPTGIRLVNLGVLESNINKIIKYVRTTTGRSVRFLLPVKGNAYGHGMCRVAEFAERKKLCDYLGVAHLHEAWTLRNYGIKMPILILGQTLPTAENCKSIVKQSIEQAVSDESLLTALDREANRQKKKVAVHLLVDTGMGRCGVLPRDLYSLIDRFGSCTNTHLAGVMTHFSVADENDADSKTYTRNQIKVFKHVVQLIRSALPGENFLVHTSNSAGTLLHPDSIIDMVRVGIASYGYPTGKNALGLEPVMSLKTTVTLIKTYPKDHSIGYVRTYKTKKNERIGIIPIGYADGISRTASNVLTPLINGKKTRSVGRISMDQMAIRVYATTNIGDEVILIGSQNGVSNTADDIARQTGTIPYEILCSVGNASRLRTEYLY